VLNDLVFSARGTTAGDDGVSIALESEGVLADGGPPNVGEGACTHTVNSFDLVLADDGVLQSSAVLKDKDCVAVSAFLVTSA